MPFPNDCHTNMSQVTQVLLKPKKIVKFAILWWHVAFIVCSNAQTVNKKAAEVEEKKTNFLLKLKFWFGKISSEKSVSIKLSETMSNLFP